MSSPDEKEHDAELGDELEESAEEENASKDAAGETDASKDELENSDDEKEDESELEEAVANGNSKGAMTAKADEDEPKYEDEGDLGESALDQLSQAVEQRPELDRKRVIEAALFLANKPLSPADLAILSHCSVKEASRMIYDLQNEYEEGKTALQVEFINNEARMQVKSTYLPAVSSLSKEIELSRKSLRILALIAKRGQILQSGLKNYFRGEIYAYVTELRDRGYIISEKKGNTRLLKPTRKFFEHFQQAAKQG